MIGTKEICALLLASGMGAGSVVAVQQAKPAIHKTKAKAKPKVHKVSQARVQQASLQECPTIAPVGPAELAPILAEAPTESLGFASVPQGVLPAGGGGGGGGGGLPGGGGGGGSSFLPDPSPVPGVPQPDTWVMLVAGFGFLGLALRRSPRPAARQGR